MRSGFGLVTAIIFIVIISILGTYALTTVSQGIRETSDVYLKTQADILNQNALDYALLKVRKQTDCLNEDYVYIMNNDANKLEFKTALDENLERECLFKTLIKYSYYNSNRCGKNTTENYLPNHKMIIKAEAVTTTCKKLDGWKINQHDTRTTPHTNKISSYSYKIIGK